MKPAEFPEFNCVCAKNQKEYLDLPIHRTDDGQTISCWELSWKERLYLLFTGKVWVHQLTFGHLLQPQYLGTKNPFKREKR